jgi:signal peptidase
VITSRQDSYKVDDVVAYRVPEGQPAAGAQVVHRIIGGNATDGYRVQGDNRELADRWHPKPEDIIGTVSMRVPSVGKAIAQLKGPLGLALLCALFTLVFLWRKPVGKAAPAPATGPDTTAEAPVPVGAVPAGERPGAEPTLLPGDPAPSPPGDPVPTPPPPRVEDQAAAPPPAPPMIKWRP